MTRCGALQLRLVLCWGIFTSEIISLVLIIPSKSDFIEVPSPPVVTVTLEETHVYMCNHSETERINWRVNDSLLGFEIFSPKIDQRIIPFPNGSRVYTLTIGGHLEHNASSIQCSARLLNSSTVVTPSVMFFIQGIPQNVNKLVRNGTSIIWEAPFFLNLTNVEPDLVYCMEVYNITCGRSLLISVCNVMETKYSSGDLQAGYIYEYTVTPRSNVEGAPNGTSKTIRDEFMKLPNGHTPTFGNVDSDNTSIKIKLHLKMGTGDEEKSSNQVHATSYSLLLNPLDGYKEFQSMSLLMPTTVSQNRKSLTLDASLPFRRRFNYTILAHGCQEHPVMKAAELSTHDIQNVSINSPRPGEIELTGNFINGSKSTGVLVVVILSTTEVLYHLVQRGRSDLHVDYTVANVVGGNHVVSVFVVEDNRVPVNRSALAPRVVFVMHGKTREKSLPIEYDVQPTTAGVCINCTFMDSSATDCVAVVHQRISQLNSSGLMNIESSHKFTRSGDTASGCIEGVNLEDYQVGVIGIKPLLPLTTDPPGPSSLHCTFVCQTAVVVVLVFVLVLAVVATMCIVKLFNNRQQKTTPQSPESPLPKPSLTNEYETVAPASPTEATGDNMLLLRITSDGLSLQPSREQPNNQGGSAPSTAPPVPEDGADLASQAQIHGLVKADSTIVVYSETVATRASTVPHTTFADNVVYHEVQGYQNSQGQRYTMISDLSPRGGKPDDLHKTESAYSEIKHALSAGQVVTAERTKSSEDHSLQPKEEPASLTPTPAPFTLEHLLPELMPHASKWQSLGETLSLDDDRLDEIFTNNETDEACLEEMLQLYLQRSDLNHSWEEIETALEKIKKAQNASDYNSTFEEESVQHPNERCGSDGGTFESGIESKAIPVDTTIEVDNRPCPVMDNNETTSPCEDIRQNTSNFTVTYGHELQYNKNGIQWKSQHVIEELSTQHKLDSYCSEEPHSVSDGSRISGVLVLVRESQLWSMKRFVGKNVETITSTIVTGKNCRRSMKTYMCSAV